MMATEQRRIRYNTRTHKRRMCLVCLFMDVSADADRVSQPHVKTVLLNFASGNPKICASRQMKGYSAQLGCYKIQTDTNLMRAGTQLAIACHTNICMIREGVLAVKHSCWKSHCAV